MRGPRGCPSTWVPRGPRIALRGHRERQRRHATDKKYDEKQPQASGTGNDSVADESPEKERPEAAVERPSDERDGAADQCDRHAPAQVDTDGHTTKNRKDFRDKRERHSRHGPSPYQTSPTDGNRMTMTAQTR